MSENAPRRPLFPGAPFALASALLFGAVPPLAKSLLNTVSGVMLAALLYIGAGGGLFLCQLLRGRSNEARLRKADIPWLALAILAGGVTGPVLLMLGLSRTSAANASLLLNLESLATMAIAWLVYKENVDRRLLLGALAILSGAVLLSWHGSGPRPDTGALLVAGACLAWGLDNNLTRKISGADPMSIAMIKGLVAGAVNLTLALVVGLPIPSALTTAAAALIGFFGIGVSLVMFILALRHLGAARTGAYYSTAPFIGAILSILFLGEPVTVPLAVAGILMAIGLWIHLSERHEHEHFHEGMEHEHRHVHDEHHQHAHEEPIAEPHSHRHRHPPMRHKHPHYPDVHHRHDHG